MTDTLTSRPAPNTNGYIMIGAIILLLVAGGARFIGLGSLSVWEDEISHTGTSHELVGLLMRWQTTGAPEAAPLPWIELKIARKVLGTSAFAMRFPSALYGTMTVLLLYVIVGRFVGWRVAFVAAMLLAVHPFWLEWTRQTKMYGHTLFFTTLAVGLALSATQQTSERQAMWHDWRWWSLGFAFMLMHACNPQLVVLIAAIGFWLGIVALVQIVQRRPGGLALLLGPALSAVVYMGSWAATGIGKMLLMLGSHKTIAPEQRADFIDTMRDVAVDLAGYLPLPVAIILWLLAATGLVLLAKSGRWRLVLLLVIIGGASVASFPLIASKHFFATRYVLSALPAFCVGLAYLGVHLWSMPRSLPTSGKTLVAAAILAGLAMVWLPAWRESYTVSRMAVGEAIAPLQHQAADPEVIVMIPDWYVNLTKHPSYAIKSARLIRPPKAGRFTVRTEADTTPGASLKPFDADFYDVFDLTKPPPPATWLFLSDPEKYLPAAEELLAAYGLNTPEHRAQILRLSEGSSLITLRLSPGKIDHVTVPPARKYAR